MDSNLLIALLTLLAVVGGGLLGILWSKVNELGQALTEERVKMAEKFITSEDLERRLSQSLEPLEKQMKRVEEQSDELIRMLHNHYRETA
ncbi:hypothetical protein [Marinobacterium jannaschii]|uniref:hypothetical protein n=1 Tax=Marinobacterium jannaschii TaxID=64970 RepID=UPI00048439FB|nr:hypothetical protein [Marinobacterium jannaschii]